MAHLNFTWSTSVDAAHPNLTYTLYENGAPIVPNIGELTFSLLMDGKADATYRYWVTAVDPAATGALHESAPSNEVDINFVAPVAPSAPKDFAATLVA